MYLGKERGGMRKQTSEALRRYKEAWESSIFPGTLSVLRIVMALSNGSVSFSELQQKTGVSSRTLDRWLKEGLKQDLVSKQRQQSFPWKSSYSLTETAKSLKEMGSFIQALDHGYHILIEGAGEQYADPLAQPRQLIERAIKYRTGWLDLFFEMDPSWLQIHSSYVQILFSAINAITFWGMFYTFNFPHIKEKAKEIMREKGILQPSEESLLEGVLTT